MVCHVSDQSSEMLELLGHKKIAIGTKTGSKKENSVLTIPGNKDSQQQSSTSFDQYQRTTGKKYFCKV